MGKWFVYDGPESQLSIWGELLVQGVPKFVERDSLVSKLEAMGVPEAAAPVVEKKVAKAPSKTTKKIIKKVAKKKTKRGS